MRRGVRNHRPLLAAWGDRTGDLVDRRLAEAAAEWEYELLGDGLPWESCHEHEEEMRSDPVAWLLGHAAARLRALGAPADLQHRMRLLGLTDEDRWTDPHWPGHRY